VFSPATYCDDFHTNRVHCERTVVKGSSIDRVHRSQFRIATSSPAQSGDVIATYYDPATGCEFVVARPAEQPLLWLSYLDGARASYRKFGVECVLEYDRIRDGSSTSLFYVALQPDGQVMGGMRVQGPYQSADQAHAVEEWAAFDDDAEVRREISERIPAGVIEMKTGWVSDTASRRAELTAGLARLFVHSINLMGVRYAFGTVGTHAVKRWQTTGGVVSANVAPVAYPDSRYRTVLMWWDRETYADLAAVEQLPAIMDESSQLTGGARSDGSIPSRVDLLTAGRGAPALTFSPTQPFCFKTAVSTTEQCRLICIPTRGSRGDRASNLVAE